MKFFVTLTFVFLSSLLLAQNHINTKNDVGVNGYDLVSYFNNKPVKGLEKYSTVINEVIYYFSDSNNLRSFEENPQKFLPQYGGWCAYAMGKDGSKVKIDPETYKIVNGKLYLFYNFYLTNTLKSWNENENELMKQADINWGKIIKS